ncbi:hypothetical protein PspLS_07097 [Pyricularia sp. CBS 133598]|nr:hypothetical protein PspLS_07097 [Pyricularia sp. CBS 133598]
MPFGNQHHRALQGLYNWRLFSCIVVLLAFTILAVAFLISSIPNNNKEPKSSPTHDIDQTATKAITVNVSTYRTDSTSL